MTARNHHFVPQCYLKGFVRHRDKPKLFVVDRQNRTAFQTHPRNVAAERDFHAIDLEGHAPDALEGALAQFEGQLADALGRIIADREIRSEDDRVYLLNLVAMLAVKNPRHRRSFMDFQERLYDMIGDVVTANDTIWNSQMRQVKEAGFIEKESAVTRKQARDFLQRGEYTIDMNTGYQVGLELNALDTVLRCCADRHWILLRAPPDSPGFITSDHPVCLFWSDLNMRSGLLPPGHGMKATEVLFPISSGLAWIGTFEHPARIIDATEEKVRTFNAAVLSVCHRQVYGTDGDCAYQAHPGDKPRRLRELPYDGRFAARKETKTKMRIALPRREA
ncbi:DUF4238 domain-containing protein [Plastoroseomonas arctica]|uniref:DUF4238 domain-containing protein n=1 Tax=Plastoroseomonas arctica TaxID=1509237 RepID=A0AAF1JVF9_9PROT|nr:DUF4238 domain-containing protein [Plastoroseomonas arctica]MBR0654586.1 DUF4238 domain-containing protein [Plastoroseomonas arctica]